MKRQEKRSEKDYYFSGGLAEVVSHPSEVTFQYFQKWFVGSRSLGRAMQLLQLPYQKIELPILQLVESESVVQLLNEEKTLYEKTIFTYKKNTSEEATPQLTIAWSKLFNPLNWAGSFQILMAQSRWIGSPDAIITNAERWLSSIPTVDQSNNLEETEEVLWRDVWPAVIAIGLVAEFYHHYVLSEGKGQADVIEKYCSSLIAKEDWFFRSISDQYLVKTGKLSFDEFMNQYGTRADNDYELTCPRWSEIPEKLKQRIDQSAPPPQGGEAGAIPKKVEKVANTFCTLQLLRSQAKQKALLHIQHFRELLVKENSISPEYTSVSVKNQTKQNPDSSITNGKGIVVSQGSVTGVVKMIQSNEEQIDSGTIGIFPNASPQFATQFTKCCGLIFLKGGQTSHGAIVAREFRIPAIIDSHAGSIPNHSKIFLNATEGTWSIV